MLRVVREVRCIFSRRLKVSNVLDSLTAAGNSFQILVYSASNLVATVHTSVAQSHGVYEDRPIEL